MNKVLFVLLVLLSACGNSKLKVAEVRSLELEYSPETNLNYGVTFLAKVKAINNDGKEFDVTSNRKLDFVSNGIRHTGSSFVITQLPTSYEDQPIKYQLSLTDKEERYEQQGTLHLNYRGGITILGNGETGANGEDQKDRGTPLVWRNGNDGDDGGIGQPGSAGKNLQIKIWKEGDCFFLYVIDLDSIWSPLKYKTFATSTITIDVSGGHGGDGGNGGDGGQGKDGVKKDDGKTKEPGKGGNGGNGGQGGSGGDGGNLHVIIHPEASAISGILSYSVRGGMGGEGGKAGGAGKPGEALDGQKEGEFGQAGFSGQLGQMGGDGQVNIEFNDFDPEPLKD